MRGLFRGLYRGYIGDSIGEHYGGIKGDSRSLDYGSYLGPKFWGITDFSQVFFNTLHPRPWDQSDGVEIMSIGVQLRCPMWSSLGVF